MSLWPFLLVACVANLTLQLVKSCQTFETRHECVDTYGLPLESPFFVTSNTQCATSCADKNQCLSFVYNNKTLQCRLNKQRNLCPLRTCDVGLFYGEVLMPSAANCVTSPEDPSLRLCNGSGPHEGRVEVNFDGAWGTICDDGTGNNWDNTTAEVVCEMFGYQFGIARVDAYFGEGDRCIWMDNVNCVGTVTSLFDCKARVTGGVNNCEHSQDVGVTCYNLTRS